VRSVEASPRLRRLLAAGGLLTIVYLSAAIAAGTAAGPTRLVPARLGGYPDWLRGPLSGLNLPLSRPGFTFAVALMFVAYLVVVACAGSLRTRWVLLACAAAHVAVFLGPPLLSADVMGYIDWARMGALHGLSPYVHDSGSVVADPVHPFVRWDRYASPYGPLFTLGSYATVPLGVGGALWAFKALATAASLAVCGLVWWLARRLDIAPAPAVALYGLNPVVLVLAVGGAHNDVVAMAAVLAAAALVLAGREAAGGALTVAGVAVKASAAIVAPFLLLGARRRREVVVGGALAGLAVAVAGVIGFGSGVVKSLTTITNQQGHSSGATVTAQLGDVLGWSGNPPLARVVCTGLLLAVVAWLLWRTWHGAPWLEMAGWATLAVLVTTAWLLPWYVAWLLPLAAIARGRWLRVAAIAMSLFVLAVKVEPYAARPSVANLRSLVRPGACLVGHRSGCPGDGPRTGPLTLQSGIVRAFGIADVSAQRLVSGRLLRQSVHLTRGRCRQVAGPRWDCRLRYHQRGRPGERRALYLVDVDPRGCFVAVSPTFPPRLPDRVLGGTARNPRAYIVSCP
jgi:hypothetical protein